ncbi:hypothetical protein BDY21DRAFT_94926 [Lineolata rhizophorae]|uniref:Uncharacterized protein n=1 Tax=Lineolata rhizophorae TaxID=578093 RepID=A0A6A6NTQ6_9PEZI|nr:hypothetical protein BDY21DRAFT_94926 [Lineolata rhizophorae]
MRARWMGTSGEWVFLVLLFFFSFFLFCVRNGGAKGHGTKKAYRVANERRLLHWRAQHALYYSGTTLIHVITLRL